MFCRFTHQPTHNENGWKELTDHMADFPPPQLTITRARAKTGRNLVQICWNTIDLVYITQQLIKTETFANLHNSLTRHMVESRFCRTLPTCCALHCIYRGEASAKFQRKVLTRNYRFQPRKKAVCNASCPSSMPWVVKHFAGWKQIVNHRRWWKDGKKWNKISKQK